MQSLIHCTLGSGRREGGDLLLMCHLVTAAAQIETLIEFLSCVWTLSMDKNADRHLGHHTGL